VGGDTAEMQKVLPLEVVNQTLVSTEPIKIHLPVPKMANEEVFR